MKNILSSQINEPLDVEMGGLAVGNGSRSNCRRRSRREETDEKRSIEWMQVLHRVPTLLREKRKEVYEPSVVSLGPYHHGKARLLEREKFKLEVVKVIFKGKDDTRVLFRAKIMQRMKEIRHFYGGVSIEDDVLAEMMVNDACCLLFCVEVCAAEGDEREEIFMLLLRHVGFYQGALMAHDCCKLENQIPWWVLKLLVSHTHNHNGNELIRRFLSWKCCGNYTQLKELPWDDDHDIESYPHPPLHLLEALRSCRLYNHDEMAMITACNDSRAASHRVILDMTKRPFRSVTELMAKGIYVEASPSTSMVDIKFKSSYFYGTLYLPVLTASEIMLYNMVAMEMAPGTRCFDSIITSYVGLMKSMIDDPNDVKILQDKGIIVSLGEDSNDIEKMFKEMDTCGDDVLPIFSEIKTRIDEHCKSETKTMYAPIVKKYFLRPWSPLFIIPGIIMIYNLFSDFIGSSIARSKG